MVTPCCGPAAPGAELRAAPGLPGRREGPVPTLRREVLEEDDVGCQPLPRIAGPTISAAPAARSNSRAQPRQTRVIGSASPRKIVAPMNRHFYLERVAETSEIPARTQAGPGCARTTTSSPVRPNGGWDPHVGRKPYLSPGPGNDRLWLNVYSPSRRSRPASSRATRRAIILFEGAAFANVIDS
jgi:hypothetical protein